MEQYLALTLQDQFYYKTNMKIDVDLSSYQLSLSDINTLQSIVFSLTEKLQLDENGVRFD